MKRFFAVASLTATALACSGDGTSTPPDVVAPQIPPSSTAPLVGRLAFVSDREGAPHIYLSKPDGTEARRLTTAMQSEFAPAWSRDGTRLAFEDADGNIYVINGDGSNLVHIPINEVAWSPSWSPDGQRLLVSTENGFKTVAADGSGQNETAIALDTKSFTGPFSQTLLWWSNGKWSPDGRRIAFYGMTDWDFGRAFLVNIDGSGGQTFFPIKNVVWEECWPEWSPEGNRIALLSMVYGVAVFDLTTGTATSIAESGTTCWDGHFNRVAWSPDGNQLAISKRDPAWIQGQPTPPQSSSIVIIDVLTRSVRATIPDAYGPTWSR